MRRILPALVAALVLRIAAAVLASGTACHADECWYRELALALLAGDGILPNRGHLWPPGYPLFLAAHGLFAADPFWIAKLTQSLLGAATILPLAFVARAAFGERVMVTAAWTYAVGPTLIAFTHYLWPETLFLFLFVSAAALLLELERRLAAGEGLSVGLAASTGAAFGLSCLVKSLPLYLVILLLPALAIRAPDRRRAVAAAAIALAAFLAALGPWVAYASLRYERFVPLEATLGVNLRRGNGVGLPFNADWGTQRSGGDGDAACDEANPIDRDRCNARVALERVVADPGTFLARIPTKMADLWTPTSFLVRHVRMSLYGEVPSRVSGALVGLDVLWWAAIALGAMLGLAMPVRGHESAATSFRILVLALLAYLVVVHAATFGMSRFRLPAYPFLVVLAARAVVERGRLATIAKSPWRLGAVAATVVLFAATWLVRLSSIRAGG